MKNTRKLLVSSMIMILSCCLLFAGTTFAWFSDSVTSGNNVITAGNLDIEVEYTLDGENWDSLDGAEDLFQKSKWEPGHTEVVALKVKNMGSLALKYKSQLKITGEVIGKTKNSEDIKLSEILTVRTVTQQANVVGDILLGMAFSNPQTHNLDVDAALLADTSLLMESEMLPGSEGHYTIISIQMPSTTGNEANHDGVNVPSVSVAIVVFATQANAEEDSFGNDYDAGAWLGAVDTDWYNTTATEFTLYSAEELAGLAILVNNGVDNFKGKTIKLGSNLDLNNVEWNPIGTSTLQFKGNFNGNGYTIYNLNVEGYKSNAGLFGNTAEGKIENVHVHNATVSGRLNVGVISGQPYTTSYSNITVTGKVEVNGMAYVGGVFGKHVYANIDNVTVNVTEDSYVKAHSIENGVAYRTYVGGVIGFMGEGSHVVSNVTSNINVLGSTIDVGGITGIAHYGNSFKNCVATGNVEIYAAEEVAEAEEIGGIAGVWHNENGTTVTFDNCEFTGTLSTNVAAADLEDNKITGKAYSVTGKGQLIIDGVVVTNSVEEIKTVLGNGGSVLLSSDVTAPLSGSAIYGTPVAIQQKNGGIINGNRNSLHIENPQYNGYAIETYGGTIKNLTITTAVGRGIVISSPKEDIYIENVVVDGPGYAINTTEHNGQILIVTKSIIKGWTSLDGLESASFANCSFGENSSKYWQNNGYSQDYDRLIRPYVNATFTDCTFEQGYYIDLSALGADCTITLTNCVVNGVILTADNYMNYITIELPSERTLADCVKF